MREGCCAAKAQTMRIRRRRGKPGSTPESRRRQKRRLPELDRRIEDEVEQGKSRRWQKRKVARWCYTGVADTVKGSGRLVKLACFLKRWRFVSSWQLRGRELYAFVAMLMQLLVQ
jgi:hypothetical protein